MSHTPQGNNTLQQLIQREQETDSRFASLPIDTYVVERDDNIPMQFNGCCIGRSGADLSSPRGTEVTIYVTRRGTLITHVYQWQRTALGSLDGTPAPLSRTRNSAAAHASVQEARAWLIADGGGHFGMASKAAWDEACLLWPPMKTQGVEIID